MFNHVPTNLPLLERETIDGVRFYKVPNEDEFLKLVSITSVTSHWSREKFAKWRKKVGEEKANEITRKATARGTDMHSMTEHYLLNEDLPKVNPMGDMLFKIAKPTLNRIDNIHSLEGSLYNLCLSEYLHNLLLFHLKFFCYQLSQFFLRYLQVNYLKKIEKINIQKV